MARYVWTTDYHWSDGPDGGEDLGIFTSKRKAMNAAREHAGLPKGIRRLKWRPVSDAPSPTLFSAEGTDEYEDTGEIYGQARTVAWTYYVQRRVVR